MTPRRLVALAAIFLSSSAASAAVVACDSSSTSTDDATGALDGGGIDPDSGSAADANGEGESDAGSGLVPAGVTKIVFTSQGGFTASAPDGSACSMVDITYTLLLPSRDFSWKICEATEAGPYGFRTGSRTLTAEQYAGIERALHAMKRQTQIQCGADKPSEQITFTSPSGEITYYDDFYFCDVNDTKIYVSGMEDVFTAMTMQIQ